MIFDLGSNESQYFSVIKKGGNGLAVICSANKTTKLPSDVFRTTRDGKVE